MSGIFFCDLPPPTTAGSVSVRIFGETFRLIIFWRRMDSVAWSCMLSSAVTVRSDSVRSMVMSASFRS